MQYKCTKCGSVCDFDKNPNKEIEMCPICKGITWTRADGNSDAGSSALDWIKEHWWKVLVGIVAFILLIVLLRGCGGEIEVKVTPDKEKHTLKVEMSEECYVVLSKDGQEVGNRKKTKTATFSELYGGGYKLLVKPLKESDKKVGSYSKSFTFPDKPITPSIVQLKQTPNKLNKRVQVYTVTVVVDTPLVVNSAEYSIDGITYQASNEFEINPQGKQTEVTFYARNIDYPELFSTKTQIFDPYCPIVVTNAMVKRWMEDIYSGSSKASGDMEKSCGAYTRVEGVENVENVQDLIYYISVEGVPSSVTVIHDANDEEVVKCIKVKY